MARIFIIFLFFLGIFLGSTSAKSDDNGLSDYFNTPGRSSFQLDILPEYEVERYVFPEILPESAEEIANGNDGNETILYRIPGGPKSPKSEGKRPSLIQHGILCDSEICTVNKPQIAVAYLLVDQGYDIWLGISNSSMAENSISSERLEKKRLARVAQFILESTRQPELLVMGYFNGAVQFFGISAQEDEPEPSKISKWFEKIPGVKSAKKWYNKIYNKSRNYFARSYDKVAESFDKLGKNLDFIIDDQSIRSLKNTVLNAWGFVISMVVPTLSIEDFSKMINHPDIYLGTPQLVKKYGYSSEAHEVKTDDGYFLTVHRITGGKKYPPKPGKPVVFLQHGILASSAVWVLSGPSKGLAYLLADEGYDVWMGNSRGNSYSRSHETISTSDAKFWDFSWHEMGIYDLPAAIDHILSVTDQKKINFIGHSQGTTSFFVMMSEKPEYNDKISKFVAYAPLAFAANVRSPIISFFAKMSRPIYKGLKLLNVNDFLPTNALLTKIGRDSCEARSLYQVVCSNTLFMVTGYDTAQINKTLVPIILGHLPAGSSVKQFVHYGQEVNSKKFRQFDYNDAQKNQDIYGQPEPPDYKISNTKVPVAIFYSSNDLLSDTRDVGALANKLPRVEIQYKVPMEMFNHIDFMFAIDAPALVYQPTIKWLKLSPLQ